VKVTRAEVTRTAIVGVIFTLLSVALGYWADRSLSTAAFSLLAFPLVFVGWLLWRLWRW
jgi:hypothetical protein